MKFATFIHNDDAKCFHTVIQGTRKIVMMDHINIKDHALMKDNRQMKNECDEQDVQGQEKKGKC
jgi:hypothetical protein